jgi:hypothetical protein
MSFWVAGPLDTRQRCPFSVVVEGAVAAVKHQDHVHLGIQPASRSS